MAEKLSPRFTVWVHLKSGHTVKFRAREINLTPNSSGTGYSHWKADGIPVRTLWFRRRRPLVIDPREIVAVETRGV